MRKAPRVRRSWGQRAVLAGGVTTTTLCLAGMALCGYVLAQYRSIERVPDLAVVPAPPHAPENFLLLGSDTREVDGFDPAGAPVEGRRSDTIMVVRVDAGAQRLSALSLPRDLLVTDPSGQRVMINSLYGREQGEQALIDALWANFGIPIHHYAEVDFGGFQGMVDAIGGVELWIPNALRDRHSGLFIEDLGCINLDGETALAFARARHLDYMTPEGWADDPRSDLSRIDRQQILLHRALFKALAQVRTNPLRLHELLGIGVQNVRLDDRLGLGDIVDLAEDFRAFGADRLETYALPTVPNPADVNRLLVDDVNAEPVLAVFRDGGVAPQAPVVPVPDPAVADPAAVDPAAAAPELDPIVPNPEAAGPVVGEPPPGQPCG
jgi:polyisoprenyl-teichoic acid--peptidoglycan teichoic acid transferase